ncbi:unnamed protein product [Closterium sp. Naga37s-1]|nr:unnamed protein product [Closterium sp. Naga37s-1]
MRRVMTVFLVGGGLACFTSVICLMRLLYSVDAPMDPSQLLDAAAAAGTAGGGGSSADLLLENAARQQLPSLSIRALHVLQQARSLAMVTGFGEAQPQQDKAVPPCIHVDTDLFPAATFLLPLDRSILLRPPPSSSLPDAADPSPSSSSSSASSAAARQFPRSQRIRTDSPVPATPLPSASASAGSAGNDSREFTLLWRGAHGLVCRRWATDVRARIREVAEMRGTGGSGAVYVSVLLQMGEGLRAGLGAGVGAGGGIGGNETADAGEGQRREGEGQESVKREGAEGDDRREEGRTGTGAVTGATTGAAAGARLGEGGAAGGVGGAGAGGGAEEAPREGWRKDSGAIERGLVETQRVVLSVALWGDGQGARGSEESARVGGSQQEKGSSGRFPVGEGGEAGEELVRVGAVGQSITRQRDVGPLVALVPPSARYLSVDLCAPPSFPILGDLPPDAATAAAAEIAETAETAAALAAATGGAASASTGGAAGDGVGKGPRGAVAAGGVAVKLSLMYPTHASLLGQGSPAVPSSGDQENSSYSKNSTAATSTEAAAAAAAAASAPVVLTCMIRAGPRLFYTAREPKGEEREEIWGNISVPLASSHPSSSSSSSAPAASAEQGHAFGVAQLSVQWDSNCNVVQHSVVMCSYYPLDPSLSSLVLPPFPLLRLPCPTFPPSTPSPRHVLSPPPPCRVRQKHRVMKAGAASPACAILQDACSAAQGQHKQQQQQQQQQQLDKQQQQHVGGRAGWGSEPLGRRAAGYVSASDAGAAGGSSAGNASCSPVFSFHFLGPTPYAALAAHRSAALSNRSGGHRVSWFERHNKRRHYLKTRAAMLRKSAGLKDHGGGGSPKFESRVGKKGMWGRKAHERPPVGVPIGPGKTGESAVGDAGSGSGTGGGAGGAAGDTGGTGAGTGAAAGGGGAGAGAAAEEDEGEGYEDDNNVDDEFFHLVIISDTQGGSSVFRRHLTHIRAHKPSADLILHLGDRVPGAAAAAAAEAAAAAAAAGGGGGSGAAGGGASGGGEGAAVLQWQRMWTQPLEASHVAASIPSLGVHGDLDVAVGHASGSGAGAAAAAHGGGWTAWLRATLEAVAAARERRIAPPFVAVLLHVPPFIDYWDAASWHGSHSGGGSGGSGGGGGPGSGFGGSGGGEGSGEDGGGGERRRTEWVRLEWVPLFEKYRVDLVVSGHSHAYQRGERNGVMYAILGGGGERIDKHRVADWGMYKASGSVG